MLVESTTPLSLALRPALAGVRRELASAAGRLSYYFAQPEESPAAGAAPPLLLLHSVNAAGSAYEVRPLYDALSKQRPVYALDLPGFGFSERSDRPYLPRLMTDAVHAMVAEVQRAHGPGPLDAVALSLGCEFLARAAVEAPRSFRTIALVSPTGFGRRGSRQAPPESTRAIPGMLGLLQVSLWSARLFGLLTRRSVIRFFLERTWGAKGIDEGMLEYDFLTTHVPGAHHAPLCFLAGHLFSRDIQPLYDRLSLPVWVAHGVRGDFVDYRYREVVSAKPNWRFDVFPTGAMPYFEQPEPFLAAYQRFLAAA